MTFLKLFLICTFKDPNLAENLQIWRKIFKTVELHGVHGVFFPKYACSIVSIWANYVDDS